ncbi:hypothetical protein J6590_098841 [Homalodisca vitripennis]|nr:hypothetical protein J6590_098841 [Homalodisca vitripennis]
MPMKAHGNRSWTEECFLSAGGGHLNVRLTCSPPPEHCNFLIAGTNDVEDGREDVILSYLEFVLTSCKNTFCGYYFRSPPDTTSAPATL